MRTCRVLGVLTLSALAVVLTPIPAQGQEPASASEVATPAVADVAISPEAQEERDRILSLLAYSIAFSDWQRDGVRPERGHNIAAVLVERATGRAVFWARNCNAIKNNGTQHAETQLMWHFLEKSGTKYLDKYEVYTTLESDCHRRESLAVLK